MLFDAALHVSNLAGIGEYFQKTRNFILQILFLVKFFWMEKC